MKVEQLYTGCLAQGAYYIESNGEAAVIDPLREVGEYIEMAKSRNAKIKYIFETHFHADFVSGHVTLAEKTGADIIYGPTANPGFDTVVAKDNQEFKLGDVTIKVLHTPGHTMESSCFLLIDADGKEHALFSGDTLFLGDVGRPDLAQKAADMTQEELAGTLYDSLRTKVMTLPDEVIVYPGHGAGSACGKNMSKETVGSIGDQKATNYALRADMTKEEFVKEVTDGLLAPPAYFPLNVAMNKQGYADVENVIKQGLTPIDVAAVTALAEANNAIILDTRHQSNFVEAHIPGSIFIGIDGGFAPWVGAVIKDVKQAIILVADEGRAEEVITRLARVGFDNVLGTLTGGVAAWVAAGNPTASIETISAEALGSLAASQDVTILDARKPGEFSAEHMENAVSTPLDFLDDHLATISGDDKKYMHCAGGYRSVIANSLLKAKGIHNVVDILGGYGAMKNVDSITRTDYVCPSTLK